MFGDVWEWRESSFHSLESMAHFGEVRVTVNIQLMLRELQSIPGPTLNHRPFSAVAGRGLSMDGPA